MVAKIRVAACVFAWGLGGWHVGLPAWGQEAAGGAEVIPAPPAMPGDAPRAYRPEARYGPLQAGQH